MRNVVLFSTWIALVIMASAVSGLSQAQMTTGTIQGTVVDQSGAALPGVKMDIRHGATGLTRSLVTDQTGRFVAPLLPVGVYEISAELPGFQTVTQSNRTLTLGQIMEIQISLSVAGVSTAVSVTDAAAVVEVTKTDVSVLIDSRSVSSLPLNGRHFLDLAFLTPGVSQDPERNQLSFAGQRAINSNINVDGADFNQPFFGGQRGGERANDAYIVSQEAIQEFQVLRSSFGPEFGRSTGGVVNVITKSGSNEFHGSAFYYLRHKELAALSALGDSVSPVRQQFGGSLGGPLKSDRTFFFTAYDGQQQNQPLTVRYNSPAGLPQSLIDKQGVFRSTNNVDTVLAKIDHQLTSSTRLTGRYNFSRNVAKNGTFTGVTTGAVENNGTERDRTHTAVINANTVSSSYLLNELRFQYSREDRPRLNNGEDADFNLKVGPQTQISGCCFLGGVSFLPVAQYDDKFQFADNLTLIHGPHTLKFGGEYNRSFVDQIFRGNWRGVYIFNNVASFLDVYNGLPGAAPDQFRAFYGDGKFAVAQHEFGLFFQDSWKIAPEITLTGGLRWSGVKNPQPIKPNPLLPQTSSIPNDLAQWQPRLGLSLDVFGDATTVVRIGAGMFSAATPMLLLNQAFVATGNPEVGVTFTLNAAQIRQTQTAHPEFVWPFVPDTADARNSSYFTGAGIAGLKPDASFFAPNFKNPRSYNISGGVDRSIAGNMVASLEYIHTNTVNLERIRDVNLFPPAPGLDNSTPAQVRPLQNTAIRPNTNFNILRQQESSAHSRYDAFTLSLNRRFANGFSMLGSYTLAYNRDDDSNERNFAGITYEDAFNLTREFTWSRNDTRHRFVTSGSADLPLNFLISGILTYRSGLPFSAFTGVDSNRDGQFTDKPIINGVPMRRNSFRQPNFFNLDLRVSRKFRLRETHTLEFMADLFNVLDHTNYTYGVSTNESSTTALGSRWGAEQTPLPTFRTVRLADGSLNRSGISASTPFQAQVALKYSF